MAILEVTAVPFSPRHRGGGESYPWWLARELAQREEVITCVSSETPVDVGPGRVVRIPARFVDLPPFVTAHNPLPTLATACSIRDLLVQHRPDIEFVHVHNLRTASSTVWLGVARAQRSRGRFKVLLTDHGARWFPFPRITAAAADYYVPVSDASRVYLESLASRPSFLLPTGVRGDHPGLRQSPRDFDARDYDLVFFGRIVPWKRPELLLRLARDLAAGSGRTPRVLIAGSEGRPGFTAWLRREAERLGVERSVEFENEPTDERAADLLGRAKLLVLLSSQRDVFGGYHPHPELAGIAVLEAGACGTPSLVNNLPWAHEQVRNGRTGVIVPVDAWEQVVRGARSVLDDPAVWRRMSAEARRFVAEERTYSVLAAGFSGFLNSIREGRA